MPRIDDGFKTLVSFALSAAVKLYIKSVTPPSLEGGGPVDTTTMHNTKFRTQSPKKLISVGAMSMTCAYDPICYDEILDDLLNKNGEVEVTFADLSTLTFWGWVDKFAPNEVNEGEQPTAAVTVEASNQNASGVETAPAYAEAPDP